MEASESSSTRSRQHLRASTESEPPVRSGDVAALLPLSLLESLRTHDRPEEVLEDENLTASLPRRLGLSDVIHTQIRRYEEARRKGRPVPARELVDLLRLVIRRPDAEEILDEAGRDMAGRYMSGANGRGARVARVMPRPLARRALARRMRLLARRIAAGAAPEVVPGPVRIRLDGSITAEVDPGAVACNLYTAAFGAVADRFMRAGATVSHSRCEARGDEVCEWTVHE